MNITSDWPLPPDGIRFLMPQQQLQRLTRHALTRALYPIAMGYYPVAQHHQMRRRQHDNYLLIYCSAGGGQLQTDHRTAPVSAGDLVLLPKHSRHFYRSDARRPWTIYWLHFDGELARAFCRQLQRPGDEQGNEQNSNQDVHQTDEQNAQQNIHQNIGIQPRLISAFGELAELRSSRYQLPNLIYACHQLQALLSYLALLLRQHDLSAHKTLDWARVQAAMQAHKHDHLSLDTLAAEVQLSKYHFSKKFKQFTGQSPIQYFINMKMQYACDLLDAGNQPVKQVAISLGYEDVYYFSRLFKKVIGLSPDQYRKSKYR
ncbi:AraC family transcriptional regulator [Exilibacterium tricleocarpae]|uniref:AraC family transcriptional regulator n=1 Tax=Exilibacterium tricleocarpae TaxID=2591008 RepID=A0A545SPQ6_9GAMM|nr:AraC family transcriptional regulator [Exilibacterium tricleocarpae]TQV66968.1 AraC family transcriptional regulator [Exilibacterium tricleocarpae]